MFALPGERLAPERDTSRASIRYDVAFRISAVDRARGTILRLDTLRTFAARDAVRTGAYLTGYVELAAPRGDFEVRVAVFRPGGEAGSVAAQSGVQVAAGPGLFLSDIVLGSERAGLRWENRGSPFLLNALDAYRAGSEAPLYYEMHGLVPGRSYGTTIALRRVNEPETRAVRLLFAETADAETMQMRRTMGLEGLRRGQYRLTVTVVDAETGATAVRERVISVTD